MDAVAYGYWTHRDSPGSLVPELLGRLGVGSSLASLLGPSQVIHPASTATQTPVVIQSSPTPRIVVVEQSALPALTPEVRIVVVVVTPTAAITLKVANTAGQGVYIRRSPTVNDKIKASPDNTVMSSVGADVDVSGMVWKHVRDPDGNVGWVPTQYLAPR